MLGSWLTDNQVFISLSPNKLLALVAYGEARGEGAEGMMAVLNVVNNRTVDQSFYDSSIYSATSSPYHAVILKQAQFSVFNFGDPNRPLMVQLAESFNNAVSSNTVLNQAYQLTQMLLNETLTDNTGGAVYYHATSVTPSWASSFINVGQIGNHIFYATTASLDRFRQAVASVASTVGSAFAEVPAYSWLWVAVLGIGGIILIKSLMERETT